MGVGNHRVTNHAIQRLRERWPGASSFSHHEVLKHVASSIASAQRTKRTVNTPGGLYVPFSLGGKQGFFVIREKSTIATVLEEEQCPEVVKYLEKHGS